MDRSTFNPQVGEFVKIRTWEDMEEEFGLDEDGNIECELKFIEAMRTISGLEFEISRIREGCKYEGHGTNWSISKDMLMYADESEFDSEELLHFLDSIKVV